MFDELLEANLIELPEMKRPDEANQVNDPNYCKYHRLIGHPVEKCFVSKDKIMELQKRGEIAFDEEEASANMTSITNSSPCMTSTSSMISFGLFDSIIIEFSPFMPRAITHQNVQSTVGDIVPSDESDDEGWILVTHK